MRPSFRTTGLLALGFLALGLGSGLGVLTGCTVEVETLVEGVGVSVKRMEVLGAGPREIFVEDGLQLVLLAPTGAEGPHVVLEGCENLLRHVRVRSTGAELHLEVERGITLHPAPRVQVVAEGVTAVRCVGAGAAEVLGFEGESLELALTRSESLRATGRVGTLVLKTVGSAGIDLGGLVADSARVEAIGSGRIHLHAEERATVKAIGSSRVIVSGPAEIESTVVGSGGVERADS